MRIVFHGANAASFHPGFAERLGAPAEIAVLPDALGEAERAVYAAAEVVIGARYHADLPRPEGLRLYLVPGAGTDGIDFDALPPGAAVCNCFGHEPGIAEYVMAALLARRIPLGEADRDLRRGRWSFYAGAADRAHGELAGSSIGLLGFGHIGQAVAARAKAFAMEVAVANRGPVASSALVDRAYGLDALDAFLGSVDAVVVSLPLTETTAGLVGRAAFAAMRPHAVLVNVGRGPVVDEAALYDALESRRIGGAIIDTWYRYPGPDGAETAPSRLPFERLPNVVMTPHMSGWTEGTIRRRQATMADNVRRLMRGEALVNVVRPGAS